MKTKVVKCSELNW